MTETFFFFFLGLLAISILATAPRMVRMVPCISVRGQHCDTTAV